MNLRAVFWKWRKQLPFYYKWKIHLWYLRMQKQLPEYFPRGDDCHDVPGCHGSSTYIYAKEHIEYKLLCTCHKLPFTKALKKAAR